MSKPITHCSNPNCRWPIYSGQQVWKGGNKLYCHNRKQDAKGVRWMKAIYFLGGVQNCKVVELEDLPANARYVCDAEGYSVYDAQDWQGTFYALKA